MRTEDDREWDADGATPDTLRPVLQPLPALTAAGTRLLDAASELFYLRGVRAVGVDLIAETAGTTKKTLYDRFGSKDALVALYLLRRAHRWRAHLLVRLAYGGVPAGSAGPGGADAVLLVFDALESWMGAQRRGCAFVNAYAELGDGEAQLVGGQAQPLVSLDEGATGTLRENGVPSVELVLLLVLAGTTPEERCHGPSLGRVSGGIGCGGSEGIAHPHVLGWGSTSTTRTGILLAR